MKKKSAEKNSEIPQTWISVRLYFTLKIRLDSATFVDARECLVAPHMSSRKRIEISENFFGIVESMLAEQLGADYDSPEFVGAEFTEYDPNSNLLLELSLSKHYRCYSPDYTEVGNGYRLKKRPFKAQQRLFEEDVRNRIDGPFSIEELTYQRVTSRQFSLLAFYDAHFEIVIGSPFSAPDLLLRILQVEQEIISRLGQDTKLRYKRLPSMLRQDSSSSIRKKEVLLRVDITCQRTIQLAECEMSGAMARITDDRDVRIQLPVTQMPRPAITYNDYVSPDGYFGMTLKQDILDAITDAAGTDAKLEKFSISACRVLDNYILLGCPDSLVD